MSLISVCSGWGTVSCSPKEDAQMDRAHVNRRTVLGGLAGAVGAAALPGGTAYGNSSTQMRRYPAAWPELEPYGAR